MKFEQEFVEIPLEQLHREAAIMKAEGWRFMQTHAVNGESGIDLYYSFMKGGLARNYKIVGVTKDQAVPSITDLFLAAFVFENEARELFGVDMHDIALDFQGAMYDPAESEPMTFITPEQKAAREKAKSAAAAKAAKAAGEASGAAAPAAPANSGRRRLFIMTPERRARLDAKLATMSPEKVAKVEAALKARAAEVEAAEAAGATAPEGGDASAPKPEGAVPSQEGAPKGTAAASTPAPAVDTELERKLAHMDPAKAAKVRAALHIEADPAPEGAQAAPEASGAGQLDAQLESKLALMEPAKAEIVRAALARAARNAALKGGD